MTMRHTLAFISAAVIAGLVAVACENDPVLRPRCHSDEECVETNGRPDWYCDASVGRCACRSDRACGDQEHCEPLPGGDGYCHPNRICEWNADCSQGEFCDIATSICRRSGCSIDLQCPEGHVCDADTSTCVPGCRTHGDCGYREVCLCETDGGLDGCECNAETEEGRRFCAKGTCFAGTCADDSHCEWGQVCVENPDPTNPLKVCVDDTRGPFCELCKLEPGNAFDRCDGAANYCLRDTTGPMPYFCGVNCVNGEPCPNGFTCADVLVLTSAECTSNDSCSPPASAPACESDDDCQRPSGRCVDGRCAGFCLVHEGGHSGFCSCVTDEECPTQSCDGGYCSISGTRCVKDEDCRDQIVCHVGQNGYGYCKIGRNCAPQEGVTCDEVLDIRRRNQTP